MSSSHTMAATLSTSFLVIGGQAGRDSASSVVVMRDPSWLVGDGVSVVSTASDTWTGDSSHFCCVFCSEEEGTTPAGGGREEEVEEEEDFGRSQEDEEDLGRCEEDTVAPDKDEEWAVVEEEVVLSKSIETCWFQREERF